MKKIAEYTDAELISRIMDMEAVKTLVYKRCYYNANDWREKEINELWVSDEAFKATAAMGKNIGWYVGMDQIKAYYLDKHAEDLKARLKAMSEALPEIEDIPENLGIGCLTNRPATTGLVEIAEDGKTAKGLFYAIAHETFANADGTATAIWVPEKQAYDFVKEDGEWKIWHLVQAVDCVCPAGDDFEETSPVVDYSKDPIMIEFGEPTVKCLTHDASFNWWDDYPPRPFPYETWSDDISYGPEGYHPHEFFAWKGGEGKFEPTTERKKED